MLTYICWLPGLALATGFVIALLAVYAVAIALSSDRDRAERALPIVKDLLATLRSMFPGGGRGGEK